MKNKKILLGLLALFALTAWSCGDKTEDAPVGNWVKVSDFEGAARGNAVVFTIDNTAYVGTGFGQMSGSSSKTTLKDFWRFDQNANGGKGTWTRVADMPAEAAARQDAVAFSIGTTGYVGLGVAGDKDGTFLKDFWKYESTTNTWTKLNDFGFGAVKVNPEQATARRGAIAFSVGGNGYVGCGFDGSHLKDLWKYNPATDTWEAATSLGGSKRQGASVFVIGSTAYVVGGQNSGSMVYDFWAYNAADDSWSEKHQITDISTETYDDDYTTIRRSYGSAFVIDGKGYLTLGEVGGSPQSNTWEYDPATDLWIERSPFEKTIRANAIGFAVGNRGFAGIGSNSSGATLYEDMYEFLPRAEANEQD